MKKVLIGIGILIACLGIGFLYLASKPSFASNYTEVVETGGAVEKKYLRLFAQPRSVFLLFVLVLC